MAKKKERFVETWIIENDDGSIIEFDDIVEGERDKDGDWTMTCCWKGKVIYSGKKISHQRRDSWEYFQKQKQESRKVLVPADSSAQGQETEGNHG